MTELTLTLIRVAFLAVLWLFVIAAIGVVRTDLYGSSARRSRAARRQAAAPRPMPRPNASSRHARIFPQDGQWIVEDLGSTNGTYLDRQKVTRPTPVPAGVPVRIGKTVLELRR